VCVIVGDLETSKGGGLYLIWAVVPLEKMYVTLRKCHACQISAFNEFIYFSWLMSCHNICVDCGEDSVGGTGRVLRAGRFGVRNFFGGNFSAPVQTFPRLPLNPVKCFPVHLSCSKPAVSCGSDHPRRLEPRLKKV